MPPAPELAGARQALVIATATYADPALRRLRSPAHDATDMGAVLADPAIGGFDVTTLVDRPEYEIRREVDAFLSGRSVDDLVVVYLSAHGVLDARGRLYFAAADTTKDRLSSTAVESTWLLDRLEECRARRQVLILDCCFSGAFARTKGGDEVDLERRLIGAGRGRAVLTASRAGEYSYEGEPLAGASAGSVFTAGLVDGLRTGRADRDGDGYITVEDAFAYAAEHVVSVGGTQSPQRWLYGGEDAVVLARNPAGATLTAAPLPDALRLSLDSPYPDIRQAAVRTLGEWLDSPDPREVMAAHQELQLVATQDSPKVAAVARELLREPTPEPAPAPRTPQVARPGQVPDSLVRVIEANSKLFERWVIDVAFSPDGTRLATAGSDKVVRLWDVATGELVGSPFTGHTHWVRSVAFSPDGRLLASGSQDRSVRIWDVGSGQQRSHFAGHTAEVRTVAFSPDGHVLASAAEDHTVHLRDPLGQRSATSLIGHTDWVWGLAFSPDGATLASGARDKTVRLWDVAAGEPVGEPYTVRSMVTALAYSPDGRMLAAACWDGTVVRLEAATGAPVGGPLTNLDRELWDVTFSPDGSLIAAAGHDRKIRFWDAASGAQAGVIACNKAVTSLDFRPDGRMLASGCKDGMVYLWS